MTSVDRDNVGRGHGAKSDATRERAILALLSERSIGAAAACCQVSERTLRRWLTDEAFKAELSNARSELFQAGMNRVQGLTVKAVDTLEELLGVTQCPSVRLGAARTLVELGLHQHETATIIRRIEELEQRGNG